MIRDFTKEELDPAASGRDTEITLGGGTIIFLGGALLLVCVVCFGLGYAIGHRGSSDTAASATLPVSGGAKPSRESASGSKPGASGQAAIAQKAPAPAAVSVDDSAISPPHAEAVSAVGGGAASSEVSQVKPALESGVRPALPLESGGPRSQGLQVQPAIAQAKGWMVQIAAVSHAEDAEVLVNALRKHGYVVTARRELGDSLIHVQTGPFVNRNDANAIRQRLLSDGYNAIVQ